jgi:hypothetical protein
MCGRTTSTSLSRQSGGELGVYSLIRIPSFFFHRGFLQASGPKGPCMFHVPCPFLAKGRHIAQCCLRSFSKPGCCL